MGAIRDAANSAYADTVIPNDPDSTLAMPGKPAIRALFGAIEDAIPSDTVTHTELTAVANTVTAAADGARPFATLSAMNADTTHTGFAKVYADPTAANNRQYYRASTSDPWTSAPNQTDVEVARALSSELSLQTGKVSFVAPLLVPAQVNAVRRRFNASGVVPAPHGASDSAVSVSYVPNQTIAGKYFEPNTLKASISRTVSGDPYHPSCGYVVTADDLAKMNPPIVPGSGVTVDIMGAIEHSGLVNQTAANLQMFIFIRYAGGDGPLTPNFNTGTDVVFQTGNLASGLGTPGAWVGLAPAAMSGDSNLTGWVLGSCPIPASNSGHDFTCIGIIGYGYQAADGTTSIQMCRAQVVPGGTIDQTKSYFNAEDLAQYPDSGNLSHEVSALTCDKIAVGSNSYGAGFPNLPGKGVWPRVSALVDWNIENFSQSGNTFADINARYLNGDLTFGPYSLKDYRARYWWLQEFENSQAYMNYQAWRADIATMCQNAKSCGAVPVLATDLYPSVGPATNWGFGVALTAAAAEEGALFCNTIPNALKVNVSANQHGEYFYQGHPGTRTQAIMSAPIAGYIRSQLGRPETGFKVYRLRPGVDGSVADNLLFDNKVQLTATWKEIMIGHWALASDSYKNFDRLVSGSPLNFGEVPSEYLLLAQGKTDLPSATQWLFRAIINAVPKNVKAAWLEIAGTGTVDTVWVRSTLVPPKMGTTRTQVFTPTGSITAHAGDTYTSNDSYFGTQVFTVAPSFGARLIMTPSFSGSVTRGTGVLTRQSGTGDATIAYSSTVAGWDAEYYYDQLKPVGHWVQVPLVNGRYALADLNGCVNGDELTFRVVSSGGFALRTARVVWVGKEGKPQMPPVQPVPAVRANGSHLLAQKLCGTTGQVASWAASSGVTAGVASDGYLPRGASGRVIVSAANYLRQDSVTFTASDQDRVCDVYAICRYFPADYNPSGHTFPTDSAITLDSADIVTAQLDLFITCDDATVQGPMSYRQGVTTHGEIVVWRTIVPAFASKISLKVSCPDGSMEVYEADIVAVDVVP